MELSHSPYQSAILSALEGLSKPYLTAPISSRGFTLASAELDHALEEGGFLDVAFEPELGALTAALVVEQLARLPYATEMAASALVRPLLGAELKRPICLVDAAAPARPVRFLKPGATVVVLHGERVTSFSATEIDVCATESIFAYPMAVLSTHAAATAASVATVPAVLIKQRWQVALAAEIAGLLGTAIASTVAYVSERKQFGRPLGSFQAMRHRLAEAHVRASGTRLLALKAADSGAPADAALAAHFAQEAATAVVYDLHQFFGAMGVTLEHPLHLWTYRLKALLSELGGRSSQALDAADSMWQFAPKK